MYPAATWPRRYGVCVLAVADTGEAKSDESRWMRLTLDTVGKAHWPVDTQGRMHDYVPDFIVRLKTTPPVHVIVETKGFDPLTEIKRAAAERWVKAVNADGRYGEWRYALAAKPTEVLQIIRAMAAGAA